MFGFGFCRCDRNRGRLLRSGGLGGGRAPLGPGPTPYSPRHFAMNEHISVTFSAGI
jgi:hypothetical protein